MRRAMSPVLATGVALVGAAVIVANPVIPQPADIRVAASDAGQPSHADILQPDFLESIGPSGSVWRDPLGILEQLLASGLDDSSDNDGDAVSVDVSYIASAAEIGAADLQSQLYAGVLSETAAAFDPGGVVEGAGGLLADSLVTTILDVLPGSADIARDVFGAITDIGTGFGAAGVAFVQKAGLTPNVIFALAHEVEAGRMGPVEALGRLAVTPLAILVGHPALTGNADVDKAFQSGALQPLIDAVTDNLPEPIRPGNGVPGDDAGTQETFSAPVQPSGQGAGDAGQQGSTPPPEDTSAPASSSPEPELVSEVGEASSKRVILGEVRGGLKFTPGSSQPEQTVPARAAADEIGGHLSRTVDGFRDAMKGFADDRAAKRGNGAAKSIGKSIGKSLSKG